MKYFFVFLILIVACSDTIDKDLGNGYKFVIGDGYATSITRSDNTILIHSKVLNYFNDSTYILVLQKPIKQIKGLREVTTIEREKLIEKFNLKQYWIIDKKMGSHNIGYDSLNKIPKYTNVYGPYNFNQFKKKCIKLGISEINLLQG